MDVWAGILATGETMPEVCTAMVMFISYSSLTRPMFAPYVTTSISPCLIPFEKVPALWATKFHFFMRRLLILGHSTSECALQEEVDELAAVGADEPLMGAAMPASAALTKRSRQICQVLLRMLRKEKYLLDKKVCMGAAWHAWCGMGAHERAWEAWVVP